MFDSIISTYQGAPILCGTTTDLGIFMQNGDFWYCSWDFWSCICESSVRTKVCYDGSLATSARKTNFVVKVGVWVLWENSVLRTWD